MNPIVPMYVYSPEAEARGKLIFSIIGLIFCLFVLMTGIFIYKKVTHKKLYKLFKVFYILITILVVAVVIMLIMSTTVPPIES